MAVILYVQLQNILVNHVYLEVLVRNTTLPYLMKICATYVMDLALDIVEEMPLKIILDILVCIFFTPNVHVTFVTAWCG